jgi:hypothetical protein
MTATVISQNSGQPQSSADRLDTVKDIARRVQKTPRTVQVWTKAGKIPCLKIGRTVLYSWPDVEHSLRENFMVNARPPGGAH